jgi:hypothetical protein
MKIIKVQNLKEAFKMLEIMLEKIHDDDIYMQLLDKVGSY